MRSCVPLCMLLNSLNKPKRRKNVTYISLQINEELNPKYILGQQTFLFFFFEGEIVFSKEEMIFRL